MKFPTSRFSLVLILVFSIFITPKITAQIGNVSQEADIKPSLMILGTYHMSTTTSNVINVDVDDVNSPERQKEIAELIQRMQEYNPTKIMLECEFEDNEATNKQFNEYLSGNFNLPRNEKYQIGFRLAKKLDHNRVYCIDWNKFPDSGNYNYETYARQHPELEAYLNELYKDNEKKAEESAKNIASKSIIQNLIEENKPENIEEDHTNYYNLLRIAREEENAGANYLTWWFGRNLKIFTNIIRFTESPDDRILVVYGAGHNKLLNQYAKESRFYEVMSPLKYLIE